MPYNAPRNPTQLTPEDRSAVLARALASAPGEGRVLTGYVGGVYVQATSAQLSAYHTECARLLRRKRRAAA